MLAGVLDELEAKSAPNAALDEVEDGMFRNFHRGA